MERMRGIFKIMVEIIEEKGQLVVRIQGREYTRYQYGPPRWNPYLYPLRAANGLSFLADAPTDHRHHHGFWVGHGRVNGLDFWLERHNSGRIVPHDFLYIQSGETQGGFAQQCEWVASTGETILTDIRTFTFYTPTASSDPNDSFYPADAHHFDFDILLRTPDEKPVSLEQTNEAGLPQLRVAEGLTVRSGGTLTNAAGKKNERETYKQRSPWLDCSGILGRLACGVALFDHPANPAYPTPWFTRDYGPFSPNFIFFGEEPFVITPDAPLHLSYRVYTHSGDVQNGRVAEAYERYLEEIRTGTLNARIGNPVAQGLTEVK